MALVSVPNSALVFIIEDSEERIKWFREKLGQRIAVLTKDPADALDVLFGVDSRKIDLFFFDHDLGGAYKPPYSTDVAKYLIKKEPYIGKRVIIHSMNEAGSKNLQRIMPGSVRLPYGTFDIEIKS
jgi:hypothetical protein